MAVTSRESTLMWPKVSVSTPCFAHNHILERMTAKINEVRKQKTVREKRTDMAHFYHLICTVEC